MLMVNLFEKLMTLNPFFLHFVLYSALLFFNVPSVQSLAAPIAISPDDENSETPIVISSAHQRPKNINLSSLFHHVPSTTIHSGLIEQVTSTEDQTISPNLTNTSASLNDTNLVKSSRSDRNRVHSSSKNSSMSNSLDFNSAILQPLTVLLMSYLSSRSHHNNHFSNRSHPTFGTSKSSETETRIIPSWINYLTKRLRRRPNPNRYDQSGLHSNEEGSGGQAVPMPYESVRQVSNLNHLSSSPTANTNSVIFSNLIPQPEGFPGPLNSDSILLPPELVENSGIKYWLDLIERTNGEEVPSGFQAAGSGHEDMGTIEHVFGRRPIRRNRPRPMRDKQRHRPIEISKIPLSESVDDRPNRPNNNHDQDESSENGNDGFLNKPQTNTEISPRCDKFTSHICVDDFEYPEQAIVDEIYKRRDVFELMYSEVKGDAPLVDGIPREVEESYNYESYMSPDDITDSNHDGMRPDPMSSGGNDGSKSNSHHNPGGIRERGSGFICPSEVLYGRPKLARNIKGDWKVIVNAGEFTQTVRMEKCLKPNDQCNYIQNHEITSRCAQVHSFHRLMVFEKGKGFYIDTFRIPTACSCHISRHTGLRPMGDLVDPQISKTPSPAQLSNTLWSILGSNSANSNSGGNGASLSPYSSLENANSINNDLLKTQLNVLEALKNYPQLSGQISPENVLHHLASSDGMTKINSYPDRPVAMDSRNGFRQGNKNRPNEGSSSPDRDGNGDSDSTIDYLLPGMMYAEEPLSFTPQDGAHIGTGGSTSNGAPLVQVIHVPVSSHPVVPQLQQQSYPIFKFYGEDYANAYTGSNPSNAESLKSEQRPSFYGVYESGTERNGLNQHGESVHLDPVPSPRSTNSSRPSFSQNVFSLEPNTPEPVNYDDTNNNTTFSLTKRNMEDNRDQSSPKINFSYHPIMEYIHKPESEKENHYKPN